MDRTEEFAAARTACRAMFDGMNPTWVEDCLEEAVDQGCSDRFEMFRFVAEAAGQRFD